MDELEQRVHNLSISQTRTYDTIEISDDENNTDRSESSINITYQITHDYTKLPKDQPSLNVLYANVKSIKKEGKIDELKCILKMIPKPVHLILLTETWTKTDDSHNESLELENYDLEICNRVGKSGGGVAAYILMGIEYTTDTKKDENGNNYLWLFLEKLKLKVGVVYRCPGNTNQKIFLKDFKLQLDKQRGHRAIVLGDFNINLLESDKSKDYIKMLSDTGFAILNNISKSYFTRKDIQNNNARKISIIDHACSNLGVGDYHLALIDSSLADHRQVYMEIRNPELLPENRETNETINQNASNRLSEATNSNKNVLPLEKAMIQIIKKIESKHLQQEDWITGEICKGIALKNLLYRNYQRNPNRENKKQFDKANKKENDKREAKKGDHTILAFIKSGFNKKNAPSNLSIDSNSITDSKEICEQFNIYFSKTTCLDHNSPAHNISSEVPKSTKEIKEMDRLSEMAPCTPKEISEIIASLDPHASAGIDGINVKSIKSSSKNICELLSTCINDCFKTGFFPDCLKISKVIPVHKSDWKCNPKNYTFELTLPVFARILEKLLWRRMTTYDSVPKHYVTENRYGYREKPNTVSPTIDLVSKMNTSIDEKKIVLGLFIDLNEALNKVNHSLLLKKLESLGINGFALQIMESYFANRKYIVTLETFEGNPRNIKQGVPQGSILGHLLFLIYINDVNKLKLNGDITLSPEKITLFYYGVNVKDLFEKAQQDLNSVSKYFQDSGLPMNPKETRNVIFTNKTKMDRSCKLYLSGIEISEASQAEYFGLILDSKLTWKPHIMKIKSILKSFQDNLNSVGRCSQKHGLLFYNAFIRPYIDYMIEVWGTVLVATKSVPILSVATKILHGPHTTLKCKLNAVKELSIKQNTFYKTCILVYKIIHQGFTQVSFRMTEEVTSRDTRSQSLLWVPTPRTKYGEQCISYAGAMDFNGLPEDIRNASTIGIFKNKLRAHLGVEKKRKRHQKQQIDNEAGPSQVVTPTDEDRKSEDKKRNKIIYKCTKCDTDELFVSPSQKKNHKDTRHPEVPKRRKVFRRLI